ncbi:hypothetical protein L683_24855 [Pseudomonas aeruginosa WC55]|nr:hypothetical protein L683_24855 [Pseudomonas aeruginosa WC55]
MLWGFISTIAQLLMKELKLETVLEFGTSCMCVQGLELARKFL